MRFVQNIIDYKLKKLVVILNEKSKNIVERNFVFENIVKKKILEMHSVNKPNAFLNLNDTKSQPVDVPKFK